MGAAKDRRTLSYYSVITPRPKTVQCTINMTLQKLAKNMTNDLFYVPNLLISNLDRPPSRNHTSFEMVCAMPEEQDDVR